MLADAASQQRDAAALRQYAPLAEEAAARYDHKLYQGVAHRARGVAHMLAGEFDAAGARLNQALAMFSALDARWQIGRTHAELGELARLRSDVDGAREHFSRALAEFEELEAAPDAARARAALT